LAALLLAKKPQPLGFQNLWDEEFRVLARLCEKAGGGVAAPRRTTDSEAKRRQVPEGLVP
jgi:hypothetical protein